MAWKKFITISMIVRLRYCGAQIALKLPSPRGLSCVSTWWRGEGETPQRCSISHITLWASSWRPFSSSQRADSGSFLRITQIISEQSAPKIITQRQPVRPKRVIGTSSHDISATAGTDKN